MCGIAGFTRPNQDAALVLARMNQALGHRGPDAEGTHIEPRLALGHRRLAIIDLSGGSQPRVDAASGDALVFNGEIFGYRALADELRAQGCPLCDRSDTEVLFQLIRRHGVRGAVERVDGQFAFAFFDGRTGRIHLVRDRFGEKPLYYGVLRGQLVFASEASALLAHPAFHAAEIDALAAYRFLLFEYLPGTASGWTGIHKLEPATILTYADGQTTFERYWRPDRGADVEVPADEAAVIDQLDARLAESVRQRVVADVPVGVFLSGGIDSSLITALAVRTRPDLTAFTVRIDSDGFDETPHAVAVARHLGARHETVTLESSDLLDAFDAVSDKLSEPLGDSSLLPTYLVCRAARRIMTVALGGDGADELFAGYPNFRVQRFAPLMRLMPRAVGRIAGAAMETLPAAAGYMNWRFLAAQLSQGFGAAPVRQSFLWMAPFPPHGLNALWQPGAIPADALRRSFEPIERYAAEVERGGGIERLMHLFLTTYLPEDILTKTDRASMFNGLEVRAPFLDRHFAEFVGSLPTRLKLRGTTGKYILKRLALRYLPPEIVNRKKHGFALPIGSLIRTLLRTRCRDVLLSRSNPVADWFERREIERLLQQHLSGSQEYGKKLWALYVLFSVANHRTAPATTVKAA
ncbi:MAG TPA: asparagine synthase (glutamine-hydrolyzing) [Acetobacteraceae bacterium]